MANDGTVKIGTELDKSGLEKGLSGLGSYAKKGFSAMGSAAVSAAKIATGAIAAVGTAIGGLGAAGVKYNASIEQYQTSFEVMTGSAEKAAEVIERLKKVGASTPFELPELADTTQLLMNYGFTADEAMDKMMMLGDISQGSAEKMSRIATAYGQMSSAGKVSLEDVKQMIEAGFNPLQEISESTGESMESLYDRISDGSLAVDEITASMQRATSEGGKYYQSMEKQSQTINGMISTLKDNAQQLLGEVVQPITESIGTELLPAAIGAIDQLTAAFQSGGTEGLIAAGGQIISNVLLGISNALPGFITAASQVIQSIIDNINLNLPQVMAAGGQILASLASGVTMLLGSLGELAFNIVSTLVSGLAANAPQLAAQGFSLLTDFCSVIASKLPELVTAGINMISSLLNGLLSAAPQIIQQAGNMLASWINTFYGALHSIVSAGGQMITSLLNGLVNNLPQIISQAAELVMKYAATIAQNLPAILKAGIELIGKLLAGIIQAVPKIIAAIPGIISDIKDKFLSFDWIGIGKNIISGIASGVANAAGNLVNAAVNAAKNAIDTVKGWLGIHSPSRRARDEIGVNMIAGVGEGIKKETPNLEDASEDSAKSAINAMKRTSASKFVSDMQAGAYTRADENEMAAREKAKHNGYDQNNPDDDKAIIIYNEFDVDGTPLVTKIVRKTKAQINKEQKNKRIAKGDVAFA